MTIEIRTRPAYTFEGINVSAKTFEVDVQRIDYQGHTIIIETWEDEGEMITIDGVEGDFNSVCGARDYIDNLETESSDEYYREHRLRAWEL